MVLVYCILSLFNCMIIIIMITTTTTSIWESAYLQQWLSNSVEPHMGAGSRPLKTFPPVDRLSCQICWLTRRFHIFGSMRPHFLGYGGDMIDPTFLSLPQIAPGLVSSVTCCCLLRLMLTLNPTLTHSERPQRGFQIIHSFIHYTNIIIVSLA